MPKTYMISALPTLKTSTSYPNDWVGMEINSLTTQQINGFRAYLYQAGTDYYFSIWGNDADKTKKLSIGPFTVTSAETDAWKEFKFSDFGVSPFTLDAGYHYRIGVTSASGGKTIYVSLDAPTMTDGFKHYYGIWGAGGTANFNTYPANLSGNWTLGVVDVFYDPPIPPIVPSKSYIALIPPLTSNTAPAPFVANGPTSYSSTYSAWKAFDGNDSTYWLVVATSAVFLSMDLGTTQKISAYTVMGHALNTTRSPANWTLEGSNDNSAWTVLNTQTNVTWSSTTERKSIPCESGTAFRYYRLNIAATGNDIGISEFQLLGDTTPSTGAYLYSTGAVVTNPDTADLYVYSTGAVVPNPDVADMYLYGATVKDQAKVKNLAIITKDKTSVAATNTMAAFAGHTITVFNETEITATNLSDFDVIVTARATYNGTAWQDIVIGYMQAGKPILMGLDDGLTSSTTATMPARAKIATTGNRLANSTKLMSVVQHPVTNGVGDVVFDAYPTYGQIGHIDTSTAIGEKLATAGGFVAYTALTVISKGTPLLDGTPIGAKVIYAGFLNGDYDYTGIAKTVLENAVQWVTAPPPVPSGATARSLSVYDNVILDNNKTSASGRSLSAYDTVILDNVQTNAKAESLAVYDEVAMDPAKLKKIAMITNDSSHAVATNTKALFESYGHTVTVFLDFNVLASTSFDAFDLIVCVRASVTGLVWKDRVVEYIQNGKPVLIGGVEQGTSAGPSTTVLPVRAKLSTQTYLNSAVSGVYITDYQDDLAKGLTSSIYSETVYTQNNFMGSLDSNYSMVGKIVGYEPGSNNRRSLVKFEKGTKLLDGTPIGARVVYIGFLYDTYSSTGKTIIENAVQWVTSSPPITAKPRRHVMFI